MAPITPADVYYDPYDFAIDDDPYPVWRKLRDEAPLYYNDRYDFYALSRFEDVERCLADWRTYISGKGSVLEVIKSGMQMPAGVILFEDPPWHTRHRRVLSRVFTPRRVAAIEPQLRQFCADALDPLVGGDRFDFVQDLGAPIPMRAIGMFLGIPESDQLAIREMIDAGMRLEDGDDPSNRRADRPSPMDGAPYADYVEWRSEHPTDDVMTDLLLAEIEDDDGSLRPLHRQEILNYIGLLASAGNETTTRLIGWAGKLLAEHPDQRAEMVADPGLIPGAVEELLRYEAPSPVQARYVTRDVDHHGTTVPAGSVLLLLNASANRDERVFPDADRFDIHRSIDHHLTFGYGIHFCLGAPLARLEARIALEEVLRRFPTWEVDWANAVQAHTTTVRGWESLPVVLPS